MKVSILIKDIGSHPLLHQKRLEFLVFASSFFSYIHEIGTYFNFCLEI